MADLVDHPSVSGAQLAYGFEVLVLQLPDLGFLGEEGLQAFALLLVQVQLAQFFLQSLEVGPARETRVRNRRFANLEAGRGGGVQGKRRR